MKRKKIVSLLCILALLYSIVSSQFSLQTKIVKAEEATFSNASDIRVTTPTMNAAQSEVSFNLENLTAENKILIIYVKSYSNSTVSSVNEYSITLKSGTEKMPITLSAKAGDVISIYDEKGNYYMKSIELGKKQDTGSQKWIATWASAQQGLASSRSEYPPKPGLKDNTYRQTIRISNGGSQLRLTFSNEYGSTPLELKSVHIAKPTGYGDSKIDTATDTKVTFNGSESVSIPAGKSMTSDMVNFDAKDLERITVSTCFGAVPNTVTSHTGGRTTAFLVVGDHVSDASITTTTKTEIWYFLSSIDVMAAESSKAIACFGDSITDGRGVTVNYDNRWTDILANRLQANPSTTNISVLNEGIGGNSIFGGLGPAGYLRYKRDVLDPLGVKYAIIFEAVNDIGYATTMTKADQVIEKYKSFIEQAHAKGIKIYGATITPFGTSTGYYNAQYGVLREQMRQKINEFIRDSKNFDGYIDFDAAIRDEANPKNMAKQYDCGDGLHPNAAGYKKMGECIDLTLFEK